MIRQGINPSDRAKVLKMAYDTNTIRGLALQNAMTDKDEASLTATLLASDLYKNDAKKAKAYAKWAIKQHNGVTAPKGKSSVPVWALALTQENWVELETAWQMLQTQPE